MSDAFDSDVLIYAAQGLGEGVHVRALLESTNDPIGSVVLLPEVLSKPSRLGQDAEVSSLEELLSHFELKPVDAEVAYAAAELGAKYALRAADAIHLATAVVWGAERFHTNNRKDFGPRIEEIEVVWPLATR